MVDEAKSELILNTVTLLHAVLCADCEVISDSSGEFCAVCGSRSLLSLGRVLGGCIGDERATLLPEEEDSRPRRFTLMVNGPTPNPLHSSRRWSQAKRVEKSGS